MLLYLEALLLRGSQGEALTPLPHWGGVLTGVEAGGMLVVAPEGCSPTWHSLLTSHPNGGLLSCSTGVTGRSGVAISTSGFLPPMAICVLIASGCCFVSGGIKGDFQPRCLTQRLNCLLLWYCRLIPGRGGQLAQRECHLRSPQDQSLGRWSLQSWSLQP